MALLLSEDALGWMTDSKDTMLGRGKLSELMPGLMQFTKHSLEEVRAKGAATTDKDGKPLSKKALKEQKEAGEALVLSRRRRSHG